MKTIAISAVTAGGKTTLVKALKNKLPCAASLHFDDYSFQGEVRDFPKWFSEGADPQVWDLTPLKNDIESLRQSGTFDYLLLDYPFAYTHRTISPCLDLCIFIDTPLDQALARRVLRDMKTASAQDIRNEMETYLTAARPLYLHMRSTHLTSADHVLDGSKPLDTLTAEALDLITSHHTE